MSQRQRRMRLCSMDAEQGARSRSVTPSLHRESTGTRHCAARRALHMLNLVADAEERPPVEPVFYDMPRESQGIETLVERTPGFTLNATGQTVAVESTPGGRIRRVAGGEIDEPLPSLNSLEERVEAMDLTDDEAEDALEHVVRWIRDPELCNPVSLTPSSTTVEASVRSVEGNVTFPVKESNIQSGSAANRTKPSCSGVPRTPRRVARRRVCEGSDLDSEFDDEFDVEAPVSITTFTGIGREIPDDDELEEPVRAIVSSVEREMDEAAEGLIGASNDFTWVAGFETFRGVREIFSGPTPGPINDYDTPYDAFTDIWSKDIMEHIALETNRYAKQTIDGKQADGTLTPSSRLRRWTDTNVDELMVYLACMMYMSIIRCTSQNEYWKSSDIVRVSGFKDLMTYDRFVLLTKFLHFADNSANSRRNDGVSLSPKLAKLAPVISHLDQKFSSLYNLSPEISVDESLTLFKGRLSWVQTIRSKAARFGLKSYELCESRTGYLHKFQIYTGKNSASNEYVAPGVDLGSKSTQVVLELLKGLEGRGHCVTMDNFYNCPALARHLKTLGFDCLGTLRINRKNVPNEIAKIPNNVPKGTIISRQCGDVSIVAWKDARLVAMISTYHNDDTYVKSRSGVTLAVPVSVRDYNKTMGGVDLKDQKLSMYLLERKRCVKWYMKMFKRLLNVSIHNAFIMHVASLKRRDKLPMTHREFRYALAKSLYLRHRRVIPTTSVPVATDMRLRRDIVHVPRLLRKTGNRKRCVVHQMQDIRRTVGSKCVACDIFLCLEGDCWEEWHSLSVLKGRELRGQKRTHD